MWRVWRMLEIGRRESWSANTGLPGRLKLKIMKWWCYQSTQFFLSISVSAWNLCPPAASPVSGRKEGEVTSTTQSDRPCWNGPAWQPPSASSSPPSAIRLRDRRQCTCKCEGRHLSVTVLTRIPLLRLFVHSLICPATFIAHLLCASHHITGTLVNET